jgi:2-oxo-4-hydroxy-4-carboxy-5-ureidoimidazoline decarboxylase
MTTLTPAALSAMPQPEFVAALDGIYEHSPWVAEAAWNERPFRDAEALAEAMRRAVHHAGAEAQLALIRAHPELAGRAAVRGELTPESTREQSGAGLDQCSPAEFARLTELNRAYGERFGFPFIIAVRGHTRDTIMQAIERRLRNTPDEEREEALHQIDRIAALRLEDRIASGSTAA